MADITWTTHETHVTRAVNILQAETSHQTAQGTEKVLMQIKPRVAEFGRVEEGERDLIVQISIPRAGEAQLQGIAQMILEALYE